MNVQLNQNSLLGGDETPIEATASQSRRSQKLHNIKNYFYRKFDKFRRTRLEDGESLIPDREIETTTLDSRYKIVEGLRLQNRYQSLIEEDEVEGLAEMMEAQIRGEDITIRVDENGPKVSVNRRVERKQERRIAQFNNDETQTDKVDNQMQVDMKTTDLSEKAIYTIPKRKNINKIIKNRNTFNSYNRLLNFLRCKYFMRKRDMITLNNLVNDARVWLLKENHTCEEDEHYLMLSSAVMVAFLIDENELKFRQLLKNRRNYENMVHHNNTIDGNLGRYRRRIPLIEKSPSGGTRLPGKLLKTVAYQELSLPSTKVNV